MLRILQKRSLSFSRTVLSATPSKPSSQNIQLAEEIPGFRESGTVATDYEVASGLERYELLKKLKGEDPWEDLHPIAFTKKGTPQNPIEVKGIDPERYIGCTGYPADSHTITFLTIRPHPNGLVDRCNVCGNCFRYTQEAEEHH